jgi:hypothetical protein
MKIVLSILYVQKALLNNNTSFCTSLETHYFSASLTTPLTPQLYSRGWVDPIPAPLLLRKSGSTGNRTQDLSIYSQELWPLDHRGGHYTTSREKMYLGALRKNLRTSTVFTPSCFVYTPISSLVSIRQLCWKHCGINRMFPSHCKRVSQWITYNSRHLSAH